MRDKKIMGAVATGGAILGILYEKVKNRNEKAEMKRQNEKTLRKVTQLENNVVALTTQVNSLLAMVQQILNQGGVNNIHAGPENVM